MSQNCSTSTAVCSTMKTQYVIELQYIHCSLQHYDSTIRHRTAVHPLQSAALWQHNTSQNCSTSTAVCSTMTSHYVTELQYIHCSLQHYDNTVRHRPAVHPLQSAALQHSTSFILSLLLYALITFGHTFIWGSAICLFWYSEYQNSSQIFQVQHFGNCYIPFITSLNK